MEYAARTGSSARTRNLAITALVAAMAAGTSWISVPFGPVPVTLQTTFVLLAGLLLSPAWAAASMGLYLLLGAIGLPVFAGAQGGLGVLLGPTGGFLWAFPVAAACVSAVFRGLRGPSLKGPSWVAAAAAAVFVGEVVIYAIGIPWLVRQTGMYVVQAFAVALVPFLLPDALKALIAIVLAKAVGKALDS